MKHGTSRGYCHYKCRCYDCTKAQREYLRKYRATSAGAAKTRLNNKLSDIRKQLAADWLRENQPDVWAAISEMAELHPTFVKFKESRNAG
jgi:hypothetical protein